MDVYLHLNLTFKMRSFGFTLSLWALLLREGLIDINPYVVRVGPILSCSNTMNLIAPIFVDDIQSALFDMDGSRTPNVDGFNATFFQKSWPIIKHDLCENI